MKDNVAYDDGDNNLRSIVLDINDNMPLPDGYDIDELITKQAKAFMINVKKERKKLKKKNKGKINEIEINVFPNNNKKVYETYLLLGISDEYIEIVKKEFNAFKQMINTQYRCSIQGNNVSYDSIQRRFKLHKENYQLMTIPTDLVLEVISTSMTNQLSIKLISLMHSLIFYDKDKGGSIKQYEILMWIYMILGYIEMPLVDDDNAMLYSLNKFLYIIICSEVEVKPEIDMQISVIKDHKVDNSNTSISMKIVYIIISEIFKQKIII